MKAVIPIPLIITPRYPIDFVFSLTVIKTIFRVVLVFMLYVSIYTYEIYLHPQIQLVFYFHVQHDLF